MDILSHPKERHVLIEPGAVHCRGTVLTQREYRMLLDIAHRMEHEPEPKTLGELVAEGYAEGAR